MADTDLSAAVLRELLHYDPETGKFVRRSTIGGRLAGTETGRADLINGYVRIRVNGRLYRAQRLAWLYMTGLWPSGPIDHINRIKTDNSWLNLRLVSSAQNNQNLISANTGTRSGFRGVDWCRLRKSDPWRATISHNGRKIHIGYFGTAEEAHSAYLSAKAGLHSHCPSLSFEKASS